MFCKSVDEPLYKYLGEKSKGLIEVYEDLSKLPALNDVNACKQTLIVFDDFITDIKKHPIISEYFIKRKKTRNKYYVLIAELLWTSLNYKTKYKLFSDFEIRRDP